MVYGTTMPDGIPAYGSILQPPVSIETQPTTIYAQSDLVIIKVTDIDRDTNASSQQTIEINITDPATGDIETLQLLETNTSSGVFIGYTQVVPPDESSRRWSSGRKCRRPNSSHLCRQWQ